MPTPRLPWYRFWVGATAHGKVRQLDDATFRTWVEMLDAAAQQARRGRFDNRRAAVSITRRPAKHIASLIACGLVDEGTTGQLTMHDWDDWQRWRKEDGNDSGSPTDHPPNGRRNSTRSTTDQHSNNTGSLREKREERRESRDVDPDETREEDEDSPLVAPPRGHNSRATAVDDAFKDVLEERYWEAFGSREAARDCIDNALGYRKIGNYTDRQAFLRNWVRGEAEKAAARRQTNRPRANSPGPRTAQPTPLIAANAPEKRACQTCGERTYVRGGQCFDCRARERPSA